MNIINIIIFVAAALTALWLWHRFQYKDSGYSKFEYYMYGETHPVVRDVILLWDAFLAILAVAAIILGGGWLIGLFNIT